MTKLIRESRTGLMLFSGLGIPLLFVAWFLEEAWGGGAPRLQFWLLPGTALLLFAGFIFYRRSSDKRKGCGSPSWILMSELVLTGSGTLLLGISAIGLVRNYFLLEPFLFSLALLLPFVLVLLDALRDLRRLRAAKGG